MHARPALAQPASVRAHTARFASMCGTLARARNDAVRTARPAPTDRLPSQTLQSVEPTSPKMKRSPS